MNQKVYYHLLQQDLNLNLVQRRAGFWQFEFGQTGGKPRQTRVSPSKNCFSLAFFQRTFHAVIFCTTQIMLLSFGMHKMQKHRSYTSRLFEILIHAHLTHQQQQLIRYYLIYDKMMQRICCLLNYLSILIKDLLCNTNSFEIIVAALLRKNLVNSTNSDINTSHYKRESRKL